MPIKNFGPGVSGYDIPDGRSWETVVTQAAKPLLDRELNLTSDVTGGAAQAALRATMPSGWLSEDFTNTSDPVGAIFTPSVVANTLAIPNALKAHVNGWMIQVRDTNATGSNRLLLGAGPAGAGAQRTDMVVLEVWRRLLSASPSTVGKSNLALIWQNGNVATDPANDASLNYTDDILDLNVGSETTKRVQIQYRLRVIPGVNLFAYPYGLEDPVAVANSVPASAVAPNGIATLFPYVNQSTQGDPGLWIAGDGNPLNTLGTVDGYMYCIPLLAVFRRNTDAFDREFNQNGGVASPGPYPVYPSPARRPDGLFYDIFAAEDLVDLRQGVSPTGWNLSELLERNTNLLFDNALRTEIMDTSPDGGGCRGTTVLVANEFGTDTGAGPKIGDFDAVRRRISDRSILETVVVVIPPPGGTWNVSETFSIDPTALTPYPYAAFNWSSFNVADVRFLDVLAARWISVAPGGVPVAGEQTLDAMPYIQSITGFGVNPINSLDFTLTPAIPPSGVGLALNTQSLYITLLVGYPTGVGLHTTPVDDYGSESFVLDDPAQMPLVTPVSFSTWAAQSFDYPHREVQVEYETASISFDSITDAAGNLYLPERALSKSMPGAGVLDVTGRVISGLAAISVYIVTYVARRPMPTLGGLGVTPVDFTLWYRTAAPQMARFAILPDPLQVLPKLTSGVLYALTVGSGSQDEGYPFPTAYVQTGGILSTAPYSGESDMSGRADISVADFNAETGLLRLPVYVPMVANPEALIFEGLNAGDVEGRSYYAEVPVGYIPNAYAQDLSNPDRHKNVFPLLAELAQDSPLGHRGQLVLILLIRYALFDETNGVYFDPILAANTTTASVFRIKGHLLSKKAV